MYILMAHRGVVRHYYCAPLLLIPSLSLARALALDPLSLPCPSPRPRSPLSPSPSPSPLITFPSPLPTPPPRRPRRRPDPPPPLLELLPSTTPLLACFFSPATPPLKVSQGPLLLPLPLCSIRLCRRQGSLMMLVPLARRLHTPRTACA